MSKFGYLNQNNPLIIGQHEAQEMLNCRLDRGYLEFGSFPVEETNGRYLILPNQKEVKIDADFYNSGYVKWRKKGSSDAWVRLGIKTPGEVSTPIPNIIVDVITPLSAYPFAPEVGKHFYAITLYDPDTFEESPAVFKEIEYTEADAAADKRIGFTDFVDLTSVYGSTRPNLEWRFYRMPFGGEEYLLSMTQEACTTFSVGFKIFDPTTVENLGAICTTLDLVDKPLDATSLTIAFYSEKLWIATIVPPVVAGGKYTGLLYYSKTSSWHEFPATFFFSFPDRVIGLTPYGETLLIQTEGKSYVLYGNNEDNFILRPVDYDFTGMAQNSGRAANGLAYTLAAKKTEDSYYQGTGILAFNGRSVVDISAKVFKTLPQYLYVGSQCAKNAMLENRFYVFEFWQKTESTWHSPKKLIYDTYLEGFCLANDYQATFVYRTKEFKAADKNVQFYKRLFVRGKGEFTVELLGDGQLITLLNYNLSSLDTVYFNVKPNRYVTFSIRFTGNQGAEIHDWGIDE